MRRADGCSMSEAQEELLARHFQTDWLMRDGDEPGQKAAAECLTRLAPSMWVRLAAVPKGKQPDQLSTEELRLLVGSLRLCCLPSCFFPRAFTFPVGEWG